MNIFREDWSIGGEDKNWDEHFEGEDGKNGRRNGYIYRFGKVWFSFPILTSLQILTSLI